MCGSVGLLASPQDTLQPLSMQALPALPESLCIVEMGGGGEGEGALTAVGGLFLNIGLTNGVLLRTALDSITGDLSDTRTRWGHGMSCYGDMVWVAMVTWYGVLW